VSIVGGLDIHRQQITFDYLDTLTGEVSTGQIPAADRRQVAAWLRRRFGDAQERADDAGNDGGGIEFALEGCTGWRYVAEELTAAGVVAHLADPAETANLRGRRKRAKTDRADARHQRDLLAQGRLPECWIPPTQVLEARALLQVYLDLRRDHTAWVQRIHAVLFHQGATACTDLGTTAGRARLAQVAREQLSPAGQAQVRAGVLMLDATEAQLEILHRQLLATARHMKGPKVLVDRLYGVGPITGLALTAWLGGAGRFSSARKAVRFAGLDITVYSSAGKRSPGRLSRQGPAVLRWCLYEAGKAHARPSAPDYAYYAAVKKKIDGKRAALSEARKIVRQAVHILGDLGDEAFAVV
jgi:transposase